jgi:ferric-dicitrate binding protein FerR (iron transport regulator)
MVAALGSVAWKIVGHKPALSGREAPVERYATRAGEIATVRLDDGSSVTLGAASSLRIAKQSGRGGTSRADFYLEGQALFKVVHDTSRLFVVHTANGTVEDIGTQFVVRSYAADTAVQVAVAEGKVAVSSNTQRAHLLSAGEVSEVSKTGDITTRRNVPLDQYLSWTKAQFVFRNTPLKDVVTELGRWYDVEIHIPSAEIAARRLTLTTAPNQPFPQVLNAMTTLLHLHTEQAGRVITLYP